MTIEERFWAKVDRQGPDECWNWTAGTTDGYGSFAPTGADSSERAHRTSWRLANGPIPDGGYILHHCDNKLCVNPAHLYLGDHAQNMADVVARHRARSPVRYGEDSTSAKLTADDVRTIRFRLARGERRQGIADDYRVSVSLIGQIAVGRIWRTVT